MRIPGMRCLVAIGLAFAGMATQAAGIDGLWQQVDDKGGQLNSLVRVEIVTGEAHPWRTS